jgi:hypothetical protein
MIRHLVLFKLNEGVTPDDERVAAGARAFAELGAKVPGVLSWETGWNIADRPIAYDFAINASVADMTALAAYLEHPEHKAAVAPWHDFATWVVADFEI